LLALSKSGSNLWKIQPLNMFKYGHTLQAIHESDGDPIVSIRIGDAQASEIIRELWRDINFLEAPGGSSVRIETSSEAETINRVLGNCWISFAPQRHRWLFHVHLL